MKRVVILIVVLVAVAAGLTAGYFVEQRKEIKGYPGLGGNFTLVSKDGEVSLSDFRDKVVVLYFGYVSCPDACPMTMGKVSAALQQMTPEQRDEVRVLLVSVDPERDTPQMLSNYMSFFGNEFIGLTGSVEAIDQVARNYRVLYQKVEMPDSGLGYTVDHTSNTFVIGRGGVVRFIISHGSDYTEYRDRIVDAINGV
jgi:protein SCO1/2